MAKIKKTYEFKNAELILEENRIYEFSKDEESTEHHSLKNILDEIASDGRIDLTITVTNTAKGLEG